MLRVLIYILLGLFGLFALALCVYVILCLIVILYRVINFIKCNIISLKIKDIRKITLYPQKQLFTEVHEKVGYSKGYSRGGRFFAEHYKISKVPNGVERKIDVYFDNGKVISVTIKENSCLYKKLMNNAK